MTRDRATGRYALDGQWARRCRCGHTLGEHTAEIVDGRRECIAHDLQPGPLCPCEQFTLTQETPMDFDVNAYTGPLATCPRCGRETGRTEPCEDGCTPAPVTVPVPAGRREFRDLLVNDRFEFDHCGLAVSCGAIAHGPYRKISALRYEGPDGVVHRVGSSRARVRLGDDCGRR